MTFPRKAKRFQRAFVTLATTVALPQHSNPEATGAGDVDIAGFVPTPEDECYTGTSRNVTTAKGLRAFLATIGKDVAYKKLRPLLDNPAFVSTISSLKENERTEIKELIKFIVDDEEGSIAYPVEASDWDVDSRRRRRDQTGALGSKTELVMTVFMALAKAAFGSEKIRDAFERAKAKKQLEDRLNELGIHVNLDNETLELLLEEKRKGLEAAFPGFQYDPFAEEIEEQWPNLNQTAPRDATQNAIVEALQMENSI